MCPQIRYLLIYHGDKLTSPEVNLTVFLLKSLQKIRRSISHNFRNSKVIQFESPPRSVIYNLLIHVEICTSKRIFLKITKQKKRVDHDFLM